MDIENGFLSNSHHSQGSQNMNPLLKLQKQNSMPHQYAPQMYYNPQQLGYMPPQQPQGMFGNFIMNQLSQHMYGSGNNQNIPHWW